jgi:hypothetical protein
VRLGLRRNGAWNLVVARPGTYQIELRRWAREANAPLAAGLPAQPNPDGEFPAGVALPIAKARLKVGGFEESRSVSASDTAVTFEVKLKPGRTKLQTWFYDADSKEICGAYYVYIHRM